VKTLYIFVDESGNFDFSPTGTKYFILTLLSTTAPAQIGQYLLELRYELLPNYACGENMEERGYFHASEDKQQIRDYVFALLLKHMQNFRIDAVIAQKNKANPFFHSQPTELYKMMGSASLKYAFSRAGKRSYDHAVVVFSSIFDRKKRGVIKQAFKSLLKGYSIPYALYFHDSKFDPCNQAVDYFCWAIYRKWENGDLRSYELIKRNVLTEFDIFSKGMSEYYQYKK
jgi:hypothetical protein